MGQAPSAIPAPESMVTPTRPKLTLVAQEPLGQVLYDGYALDERRFRVRAALGNGKLTALPDLFGGMPVTYVRGLFEREPETQAGGESKTSANLNIPDVFWFSFGEDRLTPKSVKVLKRKYDSRSNLLKTVFVWKGPHGTVDVDAVQFVHEGRTDLAVTLVTFVPRFSGELAVTSGINADPDNNDVEFYENPSADIAGSDALFSVSTKFSKHEIAIGQTAILRFGAAVLSPPTHMEASRKGIRRRSLLSARADETYLLSIVSSVHTDMDRESLEGGAGNPAERCLSDLAHLPDGDTLLAEHLAVRERQDVEVTLAGDEEVAEALAFNCSHLRTEVLPGYPYAGIGAKKGNQPFAGYGGRHFWDSEIFILPVLSPEKAKTLLQFRYNLLPAARQKAKKILRTDDPRPGAYWPWEAYTPVSDGDGEGGPYLLYNPVLRKLVPVESLTQEIHIGAAVAWAVLQYYYQTGDEEFLGEQGAEMIFEAARFFRNRASRNEAADRYEFREVTGPDEYHPDVDNNAYTNVMAKWTVKQALALLENGQVAQAAADRLGLMASEVEELKEFSEKIYIPFDPETLLFNPFDGWETLEEIDLEKPPYKGVVAMDSRLREERSPKDKPASLMTAVEWNPVRWTKVVKQHDTMLLLDLLGEEVLDLLPAEAMGALEEMPRETALQRLYKANFAEYFRRTCDGSSLSPSKGVEIALSAGVPPDDIYEKFRRSALMDWSVNTHKTEEGLHMAGLGGSVIAVIRGFGGIRGGKHGLFVKPKLPSHWRRLKVNVFQSGEPLEVEEDNVHKIVTVRALREPLREVSVSIGDSTFFLNRETREIVSPF